VLQEDGMLIELFINGSCCGVLGALHPDTVGGLRSTRSYSWLTGWCILAAWEQVLIGGGIMWGRGITWDMQAVHPPPPQ